MRKYRRLDISLTRSAQLSQKRACPHATRANPSRAATMQTLQQQLLSAAAADADEVVTVGRCCFSLCVLAVAAAAAVTCLTQCFRVYAHGIR